MEFGRSYGAITLGSQSGVTGDMSIMEAGVRELFSPEAAGFGASFLLQDSRREDREPFRLQQHYP